MTPRFLLVSACLLGACGGSAGDASAPSLPDAGEPGCEAISVAPASLDGTALASALVADLVEAGFGGASAESGTESIYLRGFQVPLDARATDPTAAALAFLATLPHAPFVSAELASEQAPDYTTDQAIVVMMRTVVGARTATFARPSVQLVLERAGTSWQLIAVQLWPSVALATPREVDQLAACTTAQPPAETALRTTTLMGGLFTQCVPDGSYDYVPHEADAVAWLGAPIWEAYDERWRITRRATLTLAPESYFPEVARADCTCGDVVGFTLVIDDVTGKVISYAPGINCVVC